MDVSTQAGSAAARIRAVAFGSAGTFILFAATFVVPAIGFFSGILAPFPVILCRLRYGRATGVIIVLCAITALTALFGFGAAIFYLLQCGAIALLLPELLVRDRGAVRIIGWTTACAVTVLAATALIYCLVTGENVHQMVSAEITKSISQALALYEKSGVKGEELSLIRQSMDMAAALMVRMYPSLMTILLAIMAGCNLALVRRPAATMGYGLSIGRFRDLRLPEPLVWILIVAGFAMLAGNPIVTTPALNLLAIAVTLYFFQGLAVATTVIARQPFSGILRVVLVLMLLLQPYLAAIVAVIGIFDIWGDFRTPRNKENL